MFIRSRSTMRRDTGTENGGGEATEVKTFDQLSDEELNKAIKDETPDPAGKNAPPPPAEKKAPEKKAAPAAKKEQAKPEEKKEENQEEEENEEGEEEQDDQPDDDTETEKEKDADDSEDEEEEEGETASYKLNKLDEEGNEEEAETSWKEIADATEIPIEVEEGKEVDFTAYKKGVEKYGQQREAKGEQKSFENFLNNFTPAAQLVIKALASDPKMDIEDVLSPLKDFDEVLAQDDETLVRDKMISGDKLTKDEADEEIQRLNDEGRLALEAKKIRNVVNGNRSAAAQKYLSDKSAAYDVAITKRQNERKQEIVEMNKVIDSTDKFFDLKVPNEIKKDIKQKFAAGYYDKLFGKNPAKLMQAILQIEVGDQAQKRLLGKGKSDGVKGITGTLANTKVPGKQGAGASTNKGRGKEEGTDDFSSWDAIKTQTVGVEHGKGE